MGSCLSKGKIPKQDCKCKTRKQDHIEQNGPENLQSHPTCPATKPNRTDEEDRRAEPPVEEETVKEVLLETPISKPQIPVLIEERKTQMPVSIIEHQDENFHTKCLIHKAEASEVSQFSENCSISESLSTCTTATTTTITEKREDEATSKRSCREVTQRVNRPPSKAPRKQPYTVDSASGRQRRAKSPARRTETSPETSKVSSRTTARGRESDQVSTKKLSVGSAGVRRDPGEGSGRRSRSPSTRTASGVGKASTGRTPLKANGGAVRQSPADQRVMNSSGAGVEEKKDTVSPDAHESLENPHVSLECFIFL